MDRGVSFRGDSRAVILVLLPTACPDDIRVLECQHSEAAFDR